MVTGHSRLLCGVEERFAIATLNVVCWSAFARSDGDSCKGCGLNVGRGSEGAGDENAE